MFIKGSRIGADGGAGKVWRQAVENTMRAAPWYG
jgi:hypothetical protein